MTYNFEFCHKFTYPHFKVTFLNIFFKILNFSLLKMQKHTNHKTAITQPFFTYNPDIFHEHKQHNL